MIWHKMMRWVCTWKPTMYDKLTRGCVAGPLHPADAGPHSRHGRAALHQLLCWGDPVDVVHGQDRAAVRMCCKHRGFVGIGAVAPGSPLDCPAVAQTVPYTLGHQLVPLQCGVVSVEW